MRERSILLNAEMVRAVLNGSKTQTRRIIQSPAKNMQATGQKVIDYREPGDKWYGEHVFSMRNQSGTWCDYTKEQFLAKCPFGEVGDRLWARETWSDVNLEGISAIAYRADEGLRFLTNDDDDGDEDDPRLEKYSFANWYPDLISGTEGIWRPSIHMPRWASRITLEITGVRVERLQDISRADAVAEGGPPSHPSIDAVSRDYGFPDFSRSWFGQTWWSIYGEESWQANPWVWVIEFKRVEVE